MDYCNPASVVAALIEAGKRKAALSISDILIRGALSGAILAIATELAITAALQTGVPLVGALIFPAGFVMIVLLNLELLTGSFAVMPMAQMDGAVRFSDTLRNWGWSFLGNLAGSLIFAVMAWGTLTMFGNTPAGAVGDRIAAIADAKTLAFAAHGGAGWAAAFTKAMLCNWMVCMGVVMGAVAQSTLSKIVAAWLPISHFLRAWVRACRRQHVRDPCRDDARGQDRLRILVALESDPCDARESVRRHAVHRIGPVLDLSRPPR